MAKVISDNEAEDLILVGQMAKGASSITQKDVEEDSITKAIREQIILKQLQALQNAIAKGIEDEQKKSDFAKLNRSEFNAYLKDQVGREQALKALETPTLQKELSNLEVAGYKYVNEHFKESFKNVEWKPGPSTDSRVNTITDSEGNKICDLTEKTIKQNPVTIKLADGSEKTVSSYRSVDFPKQLDGTGPMDIQMAVKDSNGRNIAASKAVYFTAHYDENGKLREVSNPMPLKFMGEGKNAIGYIERDGEIYTLPVTKGKYQEMMQEVAKHKGMSLDLSQDVEIPVTLSVDKVVTPTLTQKQQQFQSAPLEMPEVVTEQPEELAEKAKQTMSEGPNFEETPTPSEQKLSNQPTTAKQQIAQAENEGMTKVTPPPPLDEKNLDQKSKEIDKHNPQNQSVLTAQEIPKVEHTADITSSIPPLTPMPEDAKKGQQQANAQLNVTEQSKSIEAHVSQDILNKSTQEIVNTQSEPKAGLQKEQSNQPTAETVKVNAEVTPEQVITGGPPLKPEMIAKLKANQEAREKAELQKQQSNQPTAETAKAKADLGNLPPQPNVDFSDLPPPPDDLQNVSDLDANNLTPPSSPDLPPPPNNLPPIPNLDANNLTPSSSPDLPPPPNNLPPIPNSDANNLTPPSSPDLPPPPNNLPPIPNSDANNLTPPSSPDLPPPPNNLPPIPNLDANNLTPSPSPDLPPPPNNLLPIPNLDANNLTLPSSPDLSPPIINIPDSEPMKKAEAPPLPPPMPNKWKKGQLEADQSTKQKEGDEKTTDKEVVKKLGLELPKQPEDLMSVLKNDNPLGRLNKTPTKEQIEAEKKAKGENIKKGENVHEDLMSALNNDNPLGRLNKTPTKEQIEAENKAKGKNIEKEEIAKDSTDMVDILTKAMESRRVGVSTGGDKKGKLTPLEEKALNALGNEDDDREIAMKSLKDAIEQGDEAFAAALVKVSALDDENWGYQYEKADIKEAYNHGMNIASKQASVEAAEKIHRAAGSISKDAGVDVKSHTDRIEKNNLTIDPSLAKGGIAKN